MIRVRLFASARDLAGVAETSLELPAGATVADAAAALASAHARLATLLPSSRFAVARQYVAETAILRDGDELAVIPPVSGG